jgi:hypothetical protein
MRKSPVFIGKFGKPDDPDDPDSVFTLIERFPEMADYTATAPPLSLSLSRISFYRQDRQDRQEMHFHWAFVANKLDKKPDGT